MMKIHTLRFVGHRVINVKYVAMAEFAELEPGPGTMAPGSARVMVRGGFVVELEGPDARALLEHMRELAVTRDVPQPPRIMVADGGEPDPAGQVIETRVGDHVTVTAVAGDPDFLN